jgi:hypothetical protein
MRFRLRTLMVVVTVLAVGMAFLRAVVNRPQFETAENVKRVNWLPKSASRISYYRSDSFALYEFDISEAEFLKWSSWKVKTISSLPVIVMRYSFETLPGFFDPATEEREEWEAQRFAKVTNGLSYQTNNPNGRGVSVAYDRATGRAFVHDASRYRLSPLLIVAAIGSPIIALIYWRPYLISLAFAVLTWWRGKRQAVRVVKNT